MDKKACSSCPYRRHQTGELAYAPFMPEGVSVEQFNHLAHNHDGCHSTNFKTPCIGNQVFLANLGDKTDMEPNRDEFYDKLEDALKSCQGQPPHMSKI